MTFHTHTILRCGHFLIGLLIAASLSACSNSSDSHHPDSSGPDNVLPVVFVHGQSGSAQQFETQAMRFTSNGYPADQLFAFEYNTGLAENPVAALAAFVDAVLAETGAPQIYAIGHSRGTSVWIDYLEDPAHGGPDKVAKYVNIDGRAPETLPGGVPTIGIWGEWNTAGSGFNRNPDDVDTRIGPFPEDNYHFADKSHTETATSAEAFGVMFEYLTGGAARTTDVTGAEDGSSVAVAGRAVLFPQNEGYDGAAVEVWEVEPASGQRAADAPVTSFPIGASGDFGPIELAAGIHYEFALLRPATGSFPDTVHHIYAMPFTHDNAFFRLQSSRPGEGIEGLLPPGSQLATGLLALRQREFWGDQGAQSDELYIDNLNVLTPEISPRATGTGSGVNLAVFAFDDASDLQTDLSKGELPPFNAITFLTAADVYIPADIAGNGTVTVRLVTRGGGEQVLNLPNRPSIGDRNTVMFRDDLQ